MRRKAEYTRRDSTTTAKSGLPSSWPNWNAASLTRSPTRGGSPPLAVRVGRLAAPATGGAPGHWGALVHDIGELDVPEAIFEIPGSLPTSQREDRGPTPRHRRALARDHDRPGIVGPLRTLPARTLRRQRGYPDRRGGHEVPLTIALVAVCDCWDAITELRPYRTTPARTTTRCARWKGVRSSVELSAVDWLLETVVTRCDGQVCAG